MSFLGIDYGTKRVGIAVSDEHGAMAFPFSVIKNDHRLIENIKKIIEEKNIKKIVIGESKNYKMQYNTIMVDVLEFKENLARETGIDAVFHPEYLTSAQAERIQGKNDNIDASAATIILQSYIDLNITKR